MSNPGVNNLLDNSFPDLIWELETHLGLNWKSQSREDYIMIDDDKTPYSKVKDTGEYFAKKSNSGELNETSMTDILQQVSLVSLRLSYMGMFSNAYNSLVLIPSKSDYQGIGEVQFKELIKMITNANLCKRNDVSNAVTGKLEQILDSDQFKGGILTLELRTLTLIYVVLKILNDTQTASFLAQFITIQDTIATTVK